MENVQYCFVKKKKYNLYNFPPIKTFNEIFVKSLLAFNQYMQKEIQFLDLVWAKWFDDGNLS